MQLQRLRPCPTCGRPTQQMLLPCPGGARWSCIDGDHAGTFYSEEGMRAVLALAGKNARALETPVPDTAHLRVFIEGTSGEEQELDPRFVHMHAEATRELPIVGEPLARRVAGLPHPVNIITYGKVVRVECLTPTATPAPSATQAEPCTSPGTESEPPSH